MTTNLILKVIQMIFDKDARRTSKKNAPQAKSSGGATVAALICTAILSGIYFYVSLPALNLQSGDFYVWMILTLSCLLILQWLFSPTEEETSYIYKEGNKIVPTDPFRRVLQIVLGLVVAVIVLGNVSSMTIFHAKDYYNLLEVETGDFTEDVAQISYNKIPMLDSNSARQLGKRALGKLGTNSNLVSQFEISSDYSQINYNQKPVRVSPLVYGDWIKWFNNRAQGLAGYIVVDMVTQEAQLVQLEEGIKYSDCEHFSRNLYRHLRFKYPTFLFGDINFEIDEDGHPWWVCSREVRTIGVFGGTDIRGAVLVDAVTGESTYYEEVPSWVDRVYNANLLIDQYNYHGAFINGWLNSMFGQKGVTVTTDGYNYIAMNDDVYMYTGITSAGSDESNVGFILCNQRTKESKYYNITGAEEYSAMGSAEGAVQHLNYDATFPILLNISDQPTYFMALKDSADLVKMYAMVNVSDYQITATASTVVECQSNYEKLLIQNGIKVLEPVAEVEEESDTPKATVEGQVDDIRSCVVDGNTWYYIRLKGHRWYYAYKATELDAVAILNVNDTVSITYYDVAAMNTSIIEATSVIPEN